MKFAQIKLLASTAFVLFFSINLFAQTDREKGIEFYKKGNFTEAVRLLEQSINQKISDKDGEVWNYLGLAYTNQNNPKAGRKAFEKAVKFTPQNANYPINLAYAHLLERKTDKAQSEIKKALGIDPKIASAYYMRGTANLWENKNERAVADAEQTITLDPKFTAAYILHSDALLASFGEKWADDEKNPQADFSFLTRAADSLNKCLGTCPQDELLKTVGERADTINGFTDYFKRKAANNNPANNPAQNKTPLNITVKPKPSYTDYARQQNESGTVKIAVFFSADGKTKSMIVLKSLRYGLTEQALAAAQKIQFEPEKIDGKPVSIVKVVVFGFEIY